MINMVLGLYFCYSLCLHRVYLHFFSPHLQSSLLTFKIRQRRMYKAYITVRLELLSLYNFSKSKRNRWNTLTFLFVQTPTTTNKWAANEESVFMLLLLFIMFHVEWIAAVTYSSEEGERIRRPKLALRPPRLSPLLDDIEITPKMPPMGWNNCVKMKFSECTWNY